MKLLLYLLFNKKAKININLYIKGIFTSYILEFNIFFYDDYL